MLENISNVAEVKATEGMARSDAFEQQTSNGSHRLHYSVYSCEYPKLFGSDD